MLPAVVSFADKLELFSEQWAPKTVAQMYDINAPFVETMEQAKHFKKGPEVYEGGIYPYSEPITSPYRDRLEQGLPAYDPGTGDFPWKQDWFPAKD